MSSVENDETLVFDNLLKRALSVWPSVVDCQELELNPGNPDKYSVLGFYKIHHAIELSCIGKTDEVIMRSLHNCIAIVVHDAAKYMDFIELSKLRPSLIKKVYDNYLVTSKSLDLDWDAADFDRVDAYLDINREEALI